MDTRTRWLAIAVAGLALLPLTTTAKEKKAGPATAPEQVGHVDASGIYQLSADEQAYDCKRLTGRMRIRLLEVRDYDAAKRPSALSQTMRETTAPVVGMMLGSRSGMEADPAKRHQNDIAMLKAYNAQLAAKKCRSLDLDAELAGKNGGKK